MPRNTNDEDEGCVGGVSSPAEAEWPLGTAAAAAAIGFAGARPRATVTRQWCAEESRKGRRDQWEEMRGIWLEKGGFAHWHMYFL